ncbi:cold-shock protein [Pseudonocardia sp. H11422]|uniref:cold-shock protein n=1 Tax=Pseudonocardia sp. H11422 TaxID=2835866 RepID=UPI001BDD2750|nr:cold shock domain-containing protein [Pseudonocardia sp. H11422]
MAEGTVMWFDAERGVGRIAVDGGGELLVHYTQIDGGGRQSLRENDRVSFTVQASESGPRAVRVYTT